MELKQIQQDRDGILAVAGGEGGMSVPCAAVALASLLNGRQYRKELHRAEAQQAREAGLVVVYGYSDDNMEFEGAITDEIGCYGGGIAYLDAEGLLQNGCDNDDCPHFERMKEKAATIEALWCAEKGYSWTFRTQIPHATFEIVEDGEPFCRGIVFALCDVAKAGSPSHEVAAPEGQQGSAA